MTAAAEGDGAGLPAGDGLAPGDPAGPAGGDPAGLADGPPEAAALGAALLAPPLGAALPGAEATGAGALDAGAGVTGGYVQPPPLVPVQPTSRTATAAAATSRRIERRVSSGRPTGRIEGDGNNPGRPGIGRLAGRFRAAPISAGP
jgi:hypothetical protein